MRSLFRKLVDTGNGNDAHLNQYLNARRAWNSQIDRAFSALHVWQLMAVAALLVAFGCVAGVIYFGSQNRYLPYVIEVDKLGEAVGVGPAQISAPADPRVVRAQLAQFISSARLVTPDQDLQRRAIFSVFGMLGQKDPAAIKMSEFLRDDSPNSPFKRAAKSTVNTDGYTVLPITSTAWQVDWTETTRDRDGGIISSNIPWRATLEIYLVPPGSDTRQADIQRNPLGIYVRDFNWQQR
jgi:type IV secretion system protein TrbF